MGARSNNTQKGSYFANANLATGVAVQRVANTTAGEQQVGLATDGTIVTDQPIIGIADAGGVSGSITAIVTSGQCFARAGGIIAVTVRDLTVVAATGLMKAAAATDQVVAINKNKDATVLNGLMLVDVVLNRN